MLYFRDRATSTTSSLDTRRNILISINLVMLNSNATPNDVWALHIFKQPVSEPYIVNKSIRRDPGDQTRMIFHRLPVRGNSKNQAGSRCRSINLSVRTRARNFVEIEQFGGRLQRPSQLRESSQANRTLGSRLAYSTKFKIPCVTEYIHTIASVKRKMSGVSWKVQNI